MDYVNQAVGYLQEGFGIVNGDWRALLIAVVAAILMQNWKQLVPFAVVAVVILIAIERLAPVLANNGGNPSLPNLVETDFWIRTGVMALGYVVIIGVFFFLKSLVMRPAAKAH